MLTTLHYQAILPAPFGAVGIRLRDQHLIGIDLMPATHGIHPELLSLKPDPVVQAIQNDLEAYFRHPTHRFLSEYTVSGTPFQHRVWNAIQAIPCGETRSYGELASVLGSGARAVANACGANQVPLWIPCHRVTAKHHLGGFMQGRHSDFVAIKAWLLRHESSL